MRTIWGGTTSSQRPAASGLFAKVLAIGLIVAISPLVLAESTSDHAVQVSATIQNSPPQITLTWPADANASGYTVSRKMPWDSSWSGGTWVSPSSNTFVDTSIGAGQGYEYQIVKNANGYTGYGYIYAGIQVPLNDSRGKVVLICDNTQTGSLSSELTRLQQDLVGDGWLVIRHDVGRNDSVPSVRALIQSDYAADKNNVKAVFLFGHVPVPYSGNTAWDGHVPYHQGAWSSDTYYGQMDGSWTDSSVNNPSGQSYPENANVPGDGKFDPSTVPGTVQLYVGRVDLSNLPALSKNETELLRQYLNKDHNFRTKAFDLPRRGIVHDDFGVFYGEAFASSGWRNFAPLCGFSNIDYVGAWNWLPTMDSTGYLWSYGCGPGTVTSCGGCIGSTGDFNSNDPKTVFMMTFGSWFGDWDKQNNILRAALGTSTYTLTNCWSGRPHWYLQHMGLGECIGYGARLTANNTGTYWPGTMGANGTHVNLMGDPTLRMHIVAPPANLSATFGGGASLSWSAAPDSILGYNVYRCANGQGPFTKVNGSLVTGTSYTDGGGTTGNVYMVRAVKLETCSSGSYYNASQGAFSTSGGGGGGGKSTPFNGTPFSLPGTVPAAQFDNGGEGIAYHDTEPANLGGQYRLSEGVDIENCSEGGYDVGWTQPGEWMNFSCNVAAAGTYSIEVRVASPNSGKSLHVEFDGVNVTGSIPVPNTGGWQTWQSMTIGGISLTAGNKMMRVSMDSDGFNLRYIKVAAGSINNYGNPFSIPTRIEAENYRNGGEGVGYHDLTPGNLGGQYRSDDVDIEVCADTGGGFNVGWTQATEWLAYDIVSAYGGANDFTLRVATPDAGNTVHIELDGKNVSGSLQVPRTGGWQSWADLKAPGINVPAGNHTLKVVFDTGDINLNYIDVAAGSSVDKWSVTVPLPARIEAEDYRSGGESIGYHDLTPGNLGGKYRSDDVDIEACIDTGGGYNVGWTQAAEWLAYNISSPAAASYNFRLRVASPLSNNTVHLEIDGTNVSGSLSIPNTGGWQIWTDVSAQNISVPSGKHTLKLVFDTGGINVNYIDITAGGSSSGYVQLPAIIQAEDYLPGGEGVAYHDTTPGNSGGKYRNDDVDIESCSDTGGGYDVGWTEAGEWLKYNVASAATAQYTFVLRVATPNSGQSMHIEIDGANVSGPIAIPNTGGWQTWASVSSPRITVNAGNHALKVVFDTGTAATGAANLNYINVTP